MKRNEEEISIIDILRKFAEGKGDANVVSLQLPFTHYRSDFVQQCVDEIEQSVFNKSVFDKEVTPCQAFMIQLLGYNAGVL